MIKKVLFITLVSFAMLFYLFNYNLIKANESNEENKEIVELRGKNYKVFETYDNKRLIQYYFSSVHYATSNGYEEYDYSIDELDNFFLKEYDKYKVNFPKKIRSGKYIEYYFNNEKVEFMLDYNETLYGEITYVNDEQVLVYKNIKGTTCLEIEICPDYFRIYDLKKCNNLGKTEIKFKTSNEKNVSALENKIIYDINNNTVLFEVSSDSEVDIKESKAVNNNITLMKTNQVLNSTESYTLESTDVQNPQVMTITNSTHNISDCVEDKFIIEGYANYSYTLNELRNNKVGLKSLGLLDENEEPIATKMKQIINLDAIMNKVLYTPEVESFKLIYTRTGGRTLSSMNNVSLQASKITTDIEYASINGTTSYNTELVNNMSQYNSIGYEVDLTDVVNDYIEYQDTESFLVEIDSIGFNAYNSQTEDMIQFGSSRHMSNKPYILIEFGTSANGAALEEGTVEGEILDDSQNELYNCFGYALNKKINCTPYLEEEFLDEETYTDLHAYLYEKFLNQPNSDLNSICDGFYKNVIKVSAVYYGITIRKLNSKNDVIYNNEYRIAFRIGSIENARNRFNINMSFEDFRSLLYGQKIIDFHFLRQNKLEIQPRWSGKNGINNISSNIIIEDYKWVCIGLEQYYNSNGEFYDSDIVYFAVSVL